MACKQIAFVMIGSVFFGFHEHRDYECGGTVGAKNISVTAFKKRKKLGRLSACDLD